MLYWAQRLLQQQASPSKWVTAVAKAFVSFAFLLEIADT